MTAEDHAAELGTFLVARRREVSPDDLGIRSVGRRRVQGLRREEVAQLAAISTDYYARIEQGRRPVSEGVLSAIADVLRLNDEQRAYAFELARSSTAKTDTRARRKAVRQTVPATVQALIDSMTTAPAVVQNQRFDVLATNALGRALFAPALEGVARPNMARFAFLDPAAQDFMPDWERMADDAVAALRLLAARTPHDRELTDLIGELVVRSEPFNKRWTAHNVRAHQGGIKRFHHPTVGALELRFEALEVPGTGLTIWGYVADSGTRNEEQLRLLADWTAPQRSPTGERIERREQGTAREARPGSGPS